MTKGYDSHDNVSLANDSKRHAKSENGIDDIGPHRTYISDPFAAECCAISRMENAKKDYPTQKRRNSIISWLKRAFRAE